MANEDFNTYTEVDPGAVITISVDGSRVTVDNFQRNSDSWVIDDKGSAHFDTDFTHLFNIKITAISGSPIYTFWHLSNYVADWFFQRQNNKDFLTCRIGGASLFLQEFANGSIITDAFAYSLNTDYYITITRDETAGTLTALIYTDSDRTILVDTLTLTLQENEDFQYIFSTLSYNNATGNPMDGFMENLNLGEVIITLNPTVPKRIAITRIPNRITVTNIPKRIKK